MQSKLYLLCTVLFVLVVCSLSVDEQPRKDDSTLDSNKVIPNYSKTGDEAQKVDKVKTGANNNVVDDDDNMSLGSYAQNRYSSYRSPSNNYRPRSRWQESLDDQINENEWSRSGHRNGYPGSPPSMISDNEILLGAPKCYSLFDPQYPIISDTCSAIPQARYTLPNLFGHRDRRHVAQALTVIMSSSTDPVCTRSLRHLLCPALLPSCPTRNGPSASLPCQSFCRAIKSRCSSPALDYLPCELFPYSSDYCPTNQHYGSMNHQNVFSPSSQSFSTSGGLPTQRSLQSLLSLSGHQSASASNSPQSLSPMNSYNNGLYSKDSMYNEFPSRSYTKDYRQGSRYTPLTRSSTEMRSPFIKA